MKKMSKSEESSNAPPYGFGLLMFGLGSVFGVVLAMSCGLILAVLVGVPSAIDPMQSLGNSGTPDAHVELKLGDDGCHVVRSEVMGSTPVRSLTWVFEDMHGYTLLERGAEGEYDTKFMRGGQYSVHIKAWYEGQYHQISNEVVVDCPGGP